MLVLVGLGVTALIAKAMLRTTKMAAAITGIAVVGVVIPAIRAAAMDRVGVSFSVLAEGVEVRGQSIRAIMHPHIVRPLGVAVEAAEADMVHQESTIT